MTLLSSGPRLRRGTIIDQKRRSVFIFLFTGDLEAVQAGVAPEPHCVTTALHPSSSQLRCRTRSGVSSDLLWRGIEASSPSQQPCREDRLYVADPSRASPTGSSGLWGHLTTASAVRFEYFARPALSHLELPKVLRPTCATCHLRSLLLDHRSGSGMEVALQPIQQDRVVEVEGLALARGRVSGEDGPEAVAISVAYLVQLMGSEEAGQFG